MNLSAHFLKSSVNFDFINNTGFTHEDTSKTDLFKYLSGVLNVTFSLGFKPRFCQKESFTYRDPYATEKKYAYAETITMRASHTPFEKEIVEHLIGKRPAEKAFVTVNISKICTPMIDEHGKEVIVYSTFYKARGIRGCATIMPDGKVDTSLDQHMRGNMVMGMERDGVSEFATYAIPKEHMTLPKEKFTHYEYPK
ncbi:hypothetical protein AAF463_24125 (plasmid) [Pantoea sp. BJ2]|uniref:Uncharacterized protein n=1 Tax=Pantoea sp. BJ2 TaxID=3141322 RepID=A0AAU7U4C8_9GAMM